MNDGTAAHRRVQREIERLLVHGLPRRRHEKLRNHLRDCDDCVRYYERVRSAEEALFAPAALSHAALERIYDLSTPAEPPPRSVLHRWPVLAAVLATAAGVLVAFGLLVTRPGGDTFTARGGLNATPAAAGISVFSIETQTGQVQRLSPLPRGVPVHDGEVLQIAYSNQRYAYGAVVGVDGNYSLQWYHPAAHDGGPSSVALQRRAVDEPFGGAWTVSADRGPVRLFALFADQPIQRAAVVAAVQQLARRHAPLQATDQLPGLAADQDSILLEVQGR